MVRDCLRVLVLLGSMLAFGVFVSAAIPALRDARAVDPVERSILEQARRFARHEVVYTEPPAATFPAPMPGIPFVVGSMVGVDEPRAWLVRALALTATLFVALLLLGIVQIETGSWTLGTAAAGLALIGQGVFGAAPGAARPEPFVLLAVLLGFAALRFTVGKAGALLGAVFLAGAFFIQEQALWFAAGAGFSLALQDRSRFLVFGLTTGALIAAGYAVLSHQLGPWFNFASLEAPIHALGPSASNALGFAADHMLGRLGLFTLAALLSFAMSVEPWRGRRGLWMCLGAAAVFAGIAATQRVDVQASALVPTLVIACMVGTLSLQRIAKHLAATYEEDGKDGETVILAGLSLQFFVLLASVPHATWLLLNACAWFPGS